MCKRSHFTSIRRTVHLTISNICLTFLWGYLNDVWLLLLPLGKKTNHICMWFSLGVQDRYLWSKCVKGRATISAPAVFWWLAVVASS